MTKKSIIGFGYQEYRNLSVGMLLDMKRYNILLKMYYNLDKINFVPEVLEELGISGDLIIDKPGKTGDYEKTKDLIYSCIGNIYNRVDEEIREKEIMGLASKNKANKKYNSIKRLRSINSSSNKRNLQAKNHGN